MVSASLSVWISFFIVVLLLLAFDLGLWHRKHNAIGIKESLKLSLGYFLISLAFGFYVLFFMGVREGNDFFTGYFIEKSLSLDNLFVISLIFTHLRIPVHFQHRVLFWGIFGAVIMRGVMIASGIAVIHAFHPVLYVFGAFLLITGVRMLFFKKESEKTIEEDKLFVCIKHVIPVSRELHGKQFFVKEAARRIATPLFLALAFIELADVVFAIDSVPAVLAVTTNPFVVYTSNIFAILGLRALYFAISAILYRFESLKYSLALILIFMGGKIFLSGIMLVSSVTSLLVTVTLLAGGILLSLRNKERA